MDVTGRCNAIEECYEFMLAYAAQGVVEESGRGGYPVAPRSILSWGPTPNLSHDLLPLYF